MRKELQVENQTKVLLTDTTSFKAGLAESRAMGSVGGQVVGRSLKELGKQEPRLKPD